MEIATKATESRRLLDTEVEQTEELLAKKQAKVERDAEIKKEVTEINKVFLCELCNKQYTKVRHAPAPAQGAGASTAGPSRRQALTRRPPPVGLRVRQPPLQLRPPSPQAPEGPQRRGAPAQGR